MAATETAFRRLMETMDDEGIVEAMRRTWNEPEGAIFREFGFQVIEERHGAEWADDLYDNMWDELER